MTNDGEIGEQILTLTELGLSVTQAKIYLALAKAKASTAQTISTLSGVSRPDVYRIINQLQEGGLVEKIIAKPEEFQAISIEECVSVLLQKRIKKTQELQNQGLKLVQSIKKTGDYATLQKPRTEFIFIPNKRTAYARSERMLRSLTKSLYFIGLTKSMDAWLSQYSSEVEAALSRGIDCRMILPHLETEKIRTSFLKMQKYEGFKLKTMHGTLKASFSIWDTKELMITTSFAGIALPTETLWSNNSSLIELCADYFECLWAKAGKV